MTEWHKGSASLIELSDKTSQRINQYKDLIREQLPALRRRPELRKLLDEVLFRYIPKILRKKAASRISKLPPLYKDSIVACLIASSLIYKKGLDYQPSFLDTLSIELKNNLV